VTLYKFNVTFNHDNGLAEDKVVNGWHFEDNGGVAGDFDNVRDMLKDFYTKPVNAGAWITNSYPGHLANDCTVTAYDLSQDKPRAPVYESTFPSGVGAGSTLPTEVALCFSFEAEKASGELQSRRRNRVYLGPFTNSVLNSGAVSSSFITTLINAGKDLKAASNASITWDWQIYSPTDDRSHDIHKIWVDNAWDTQRRRGLKATTRTAWTF
jgi:hypothetical protein